MAVSHIPALILTCFLLKWFVINLPAVFNAPSQSQQSG